MLAVLWPLMDRCTVVSKRSLQYCVPFGTAAWLWGTVYIDRGAQSAKKALNQQAEAVRDHKVLVMLSYSMNLNKWWWPLRAKPEWLDPSSYLLSITKQHLKYLTFRVLQVFTGDGNHFKSSETSGIFAGPFDKEVTRILVPLRQSLLTRSNVLY